MKKDIHPNYQESLVTCGCGNTFKTRATVKELHIEICSVCHPFYSGKQKFVDAAGRVDRFVTRLEEGGYDNVVGLPVRLALDLLARLGAKVPSRG